jgi:hypothetical protein
MDVRESWVFSGGIAVLRNRWLVVVVVLAGLQAPVLGQDSEIKWKFQKDKPFYQEMTTETTQNLTIMGMKIDQSQKQSFYFSWTPVKYDEKDKSWTIEQKIEGVKMNIQIGPNPLTFDSTKDTNAANALSDFFKALLGAKFTITLGPDMKVVKVEGRDEFIKKLVQTNPQMEQLLKLILSDEALKQMADPAFGVVPPTGHKKGTPWERKGSLNMGPIGSYETTYTYTDEGKDEKDKKSEKIKVTTVVKYTPPGAGSPQGFPFRIVSGDLKSKDSTGTILFNTEKGRVESSELTNKLEGKLSIEISGMTSEVELNQSQKTSVKTFDENPVKKVEEKKTEEKKPEEKKTEKKEEKK